MTVLVPARPFRRVPFLVQIALVCALAAAIGGSIGNLLGGASAARDSGLIR